MNKGASEEKLKLARATLLELREKGEIPSLYRIHKVSGIARGTLNYSKLPEWQQFRDEVEGKVTTELVSAKAADIETVRWKRELKDLFSRLVEVEQVVSDIQEISDTVFNNLTKQLHHYLARAAATPKKVQEEIRLREDYMKLLQRAEDAEGQLQKLSAEKSLPSNVRPLFRKEVINVVPKELRGSLSVQSFFGLHLTAINQLDDYFLRTKAAGTPSVVYVMCGLPGAGKSRWIAAVQPVFVGLAVYLDGTAHTRSIRQVLLSRVRKLDPHCRVVCCLLLSDLAGCLKANEEPERKRSGLYVDESVIRGISAEFDMVTFDEGFDAIEVVR